MKKFIATTSLTVMLVSSTLFGGNLKAFDVNNTAVAAAATAKSITNCIPTVSVKKTTATTASLSIGKVSGADSYKIYRATSKNGCYKYIGTTKTKSYKDTGLKSNKTYYYKVKACDKVNGKTLVSKISKVVKATLAKKTTTSKTSTQKTTATTSAKTTTASKNTGTATKTNTTKSTASTTSSSFANQVLKLVNAERAKEGLSALTMSAELTAPANKRAQEISQSFSHTRPNGTPWSTVLKEYNVSVSTSGENLAYGYNTPEAVVEGWMNSAGHRANIMNSKFHKIGIGVYDKNGTIYCTQLFSN
ncbi:MAG: Fibronectin type-III domain-containing protein [Lachnoclostridium sp.]|jgi:uncharacterized protein YkwD